MSMHTISVFVENHSGALSRIAGLFSSRGYNINSLTVAETEDPEISRMTISVGGDENVLEQVVKQLNRLIDVIKVVDFADEPIVDRELLLVRLDTTKNGRTELIELAKIYGGTIADVGSASMTVQIMGTTQQIDDFIRLVKPYGIKELVRTGKIAMAQATK
ncbi:MAG: acetolactate synthase small subunit [Chitinispirillaceae bacterium]